MLAADGRTVWLRDLVTVVVEGDRATRLRGVMLDITERKRAEGCSARAEAISEYLPDGGRVDLGRGFLSGQGGHR